MTKHTPGPWTTDTDKTYRWADNECVLIFAPDSQPDAPGTPVGAACDFNRYDRDPEKQANARLIAAAPDLLAALEAIAILTSDGTARADYEVRCAVETVALEAIAKAKAGES